jgi:hypothetical protein
MDVAALTREEYLAIPDDERPHLYPDRAPSNAIYTGSKNRPGCRCLRCRAAHADAIRKNRKVIQVVPESVTDSPIPTEDPVSVPELPAEGQTPATGEPQPAEAVYSEPQGQLTAEQVAADVLKRAIAAVGPNGVLPEWMLMAQSIAAMYRVPVAVAKQATRNNGKYIAINRYLNGGKGAVALVKRPVR